MSRWLVTGAGGMLATAVVEALDAAGHTVLPCTRADLDVTDAAAVEATVAELTPDVVVNTAAWTDVDGAETAEAQALRVNGEGPAHLAHALAARAAGVLLHVSSDYVFDGRGSAPYPESARPRPLGAYGRTKLAGEQAVLEALPDRGYVVRTAWLYGAGPCFVRTMARLERERDHVEVVDDQHGQPTSTRALARRLRELGELASTGAAPPGVYHGTCAGHTTWYGLARAVFELLGADPDRVRPITSAQLHRPAPRPAWSVLGHDGWRRAGLVPMPAWRTALTEDLTDAVPAAGPDQRGGGQVAPQW